MQDLWDMIYQLRIGRSGIAEKVGEGDGITPIGNFSIKSIGFRNDRIYFSRT